MDVDSIARSPLTCLDLPPGDALFVGPHLRLHFQADTCFYFVGSQLFDSHQLDDHPARNLAVARCAVHGLATAKSLAAVHGVSPRTVSRAAKLLREQGPGAFFPASAPKGRALVLQDRQLLKGLAASLLSGASLRRTARRFNVNFQTLRNYVAAGRLPGLPSLGPGPLAPGAAGGSPASTAEADGGPRGPDKEQRNRRDAAAPQGRATRDSLQRALTSMGPQQEAEPSFGLALPSVTCGGLLTALPALLQEGLLSCAGALSLDKGFYGLRSVLLTLAFMLLSGTRNPERLSYLQPGEFGALLGLDRCPSVRTLRRRTKQLAQDPAALATWRNELAALWVEESQPQGTATLLVDGHVKTYGGKGRLPKQHVARQKLKLPGAASCWASALGGAPLLCLHGDLNTSLAQELRQMLPQLRQLGLIGEQAGRPSQGHRPSLTLVFDRGGWDLQLFEKLDGLGVAFITWRKGPQDEPWQAGEFREVSYSVPVPLGERTVKARCAERWVALTGEDQGASQPAGPDSPTGGWPWVREIRFFETSRRPMTGRSGQPRQERACRARDPQGRQPALVTNHFGLQAEDVVARLRGRWAQESLFRYLRANFGLDSLPEHRLEEMDPQARVVNPVWREADNLIRRLRGRSGQQQERLRRGRLKAEQEQELRREIEQHDDALDGAERHRGWTPKHVLAGELPEGLRYQALPRPMRYLMDTLRMLAYRAELRLAEQLAPHLSRPEMAHEVIRETLLSSEASLLPEPRRGILRVRLPRQSQAHLDEALEPVLQALNETRTVYPGTELRLVYEFNGG